MAEPHETEVINGVVGKNMKPLIPEEDSVSGVLRRMFAVVFLPDSGSSASSAPMIQRIKSSFTENGPLLKDATRNTSRNILIWTRQGSYLRALLVICVGTITLITLTGLFVFLLFFLIATVNAIVVSFLISLAAAGAFLAMFFACVTGIYIGALSIAVFVISTMTISAILAVLIVTGWIGFFCTVWLVTKKSVGVAKHSLSLTGSAISAYSSGPQVRRYHEPDTKLD